MAVFMDVNPEDHRSMGYMHFLACISSPTAVPWLASKKGPAGMHFKLGYKSECWA